MPTLKESTFNGTNGSHFKLRLDYSYTQDTGAKKTTITYSNYFISMDGYSGSGASNGVTAYINNSKVGTTNSIGVNQTKLLGTKVVEVQHNNDGTFPNTNYSASIQTGWSLGEANVSGTLTSSQIPKINTYPILLTAPDFNDEENPTITYSTDVGFEGAKTYAYIGRLDWTGIISSREVNISSGSYTFELTNEERELLRNETSNSNTLDVLFLIVTQAGGNNYWSTMRRTLTIVNGNPTISSVSITEQNANVVSLLGGAQTNYAIENTSELLFSISASAIKGASITSVLVNGQPATLQNNTYQTTLSNVQTGTFNIVVTDTRGNTNSDTQTKTLIQYMPVNINSYSFKRLNPTSSIIRLTADITCFSGSFNQTQNVPTIQYKVGESGTYTTISSGYTFTNNKITFTNYSLGEVLPYNQQDRIYLKVSDLLTDDQEYALVLKGIPTYDAGEHDLKVNGDLYVADEYGNNKVNILKGYSTDETQIGYWIDGKPLYRRIITGTKVSGTNLQISASWVSSIDTLVRFDGTLKSLSNYNYPLVRYESSSMYVNLNMNRVEGWIMVTSSTGNYSNGNVTICVEYTKSS